MKVKLLKRIRNRFTIVPDAYENGPKYRHKSIVFDHKTMIEHYVYGDIVEQSIAQICLCLDTPLFKFSSLYEKKIEKRQNKALQRKYSIMKK